MNRGTDSILSVYSDARTEYTKQLCVFLVPAYFQFFIELLEKAKHDVIHEPKRVLWQFQNYLNEIHDWNMEKVNNEIHKIFVNCGCDYLEDLLTAVFIAHTKVLTAIRLSANKKKIEINVPKVEHFLFKVLCETSKLLWSSSYLFRDGISGVEKQQNYRNIEQIINEGILQAVRSLVPVKSILRDFVNNDDENDAENDSDDEKEENQEEQVKCEEQVKLEEQVKQEEQERQEEKVKQGQEEQVRQGQELKEELKENNEYLEKQLPELLNIEQPVLLPSITTENLDRLDLPNITSNANTVTTTSDQQLINTSNTNIDNNPPTIIIDDKPHVRFGEFDAVFDTDNPNHSDMIYDPKDNDTDTDIEEDDDVPALKILDEQGVPLSEGFDFENIGDVDNSEELGLGDYEELV